MHKRWLGLSSIVMAGLLTVTSVGTGVTQVYAAEAGAESSLVVETDEATAEASKDEEVVVDAAAEGSSAEVVEEDVVDEPKEEVKDESSEEASDKASTGDTTTPVEEEVNGLVFFDRWSQGNKVSNKLEFEKQYQEFCYDLGQVYDTANVKSVIIKVADQEGNVCIKFYDDGFNEVQPNYSNNGSSEYIIAPTYDGTLRYIGVMSMLEGADNYPYHITIKEVVVDAQAPAEEKNEETLVLEGSDLKFTEAWNGTAVEGRTLEFDQEWREYRVSLGKTIPGEDVKAVKVTFAEANSQAICIKTYGNGNELKADYGKSGASSYTTSPSVTSDVDAIAIMAMNNQTYPFKVTVEKVEVVIDVTPESERPQKGVEYDIVDLRDPVAALMGDDFIIGTAASYDEFADELDMELVFKHFNGVTLGNELKPDAMLKSSAPIITYELNGEDVPFPELSFTTPESRLDLFVDWNEKHPDKQIKIRGHVLVWHSQTPEFFFHEDYDTSKPYVTPDVMNKRLEIYIREVAQHFTAPGSKYASLFYGWDVVNEAVSDSTGTYRNGSGNDNSAWWRVYNSQEFITNAFVYANRYMPADIALFYNDYNETGTTKMKGICQLLNDVKATPGARIDGMGMQGHYQIANNSPTMDQFKTAAKAYAEIVDQVQVTELDFKGATSAKDERLSERYKAVYDTIRRLRNEGVNFTGMTIWGVTDKHSWLQTANNNGGGSNGSSRQYPLLFDDYYKAKDCFWTLVNAGELEPELKSVTLVQNATGDFSGGQAYTFGTNTTATVVPMWREGFFDLKISVNDTQWYKMDEVDIYLDAGNGINHVNVNRSQASNVPGVDVIQTESGYDVILSVAIDNEVLQANKVKFDIVVNNDEAGDKFAFADTTFKQAESSKYYAETVVKPLLAVKKGTPAVDGDASDAVWATANEMPLLINIGAKASATAKVLWDEENLYILADVKDSVLNKDSGDAWQQDSIEIFVDENNAKTGAYQDDDKQYRVNYVNEHSFNGTKCVEENFNTEVTVTEEGYVVEAAIKWTDITPAVGALVGLELQVNDADESGKRAGTLSWADNTGNGWSSTEVFGTIILTDGSNVPTPGEPDPETPVEPEGTLVTKYGKTYYVDANGTNLTGMQTIDGEMYFFDLSSGVMKKNAMFTFEDKKYFAKADGKLAANEKITRYGADYIFDADGAMVVGFTELDGNLYFCKADGKVSKNGLITADDGRVFCSGSDGVIYRNAKVEKYHNEYIFGEDGMAKTGFVTFEDKDYYGKGNGKLAKNELFTEGEYKYFAKEDGTLAKSEVIVRYGVIRYTFDEFGHLVKTEKGLFF